MGSNINSMFEETNQANSSNGSLESNCSLESNNWTYTYVPVYILSISVLGIVLNIFVLMVFILHKKPCTVPEIYLSNLAAADLLLVSFLPFWAANAWNKFEWIFGLAMCKMVNVSILMNVYCSIYFLVLISIDRYLALVHPLSQEKLRRPKFAKMSCVVVWILGLILSVPKFINRKLEHQGNDTTCIDADSMMTELMILVLGFFIPIFIILFCTVKILKALRNRFAEGANAKKNDHQANKANSLVLAVLLAFLICWVPFHLRKVPTLLYKAGFLTDCSFKNTQYLCGQIFTYLAFFNSVLNPILYVIVGRNFRDKLNELFKQWDQKRSATISLTTTSARLSRSVKSQQSIIN